MTTSVTSLRFEEHKHGFHLFAAPGFSFQTHPFIRSSIYPPLRVPPPSVVFDKSTFSLCFSHSSIWLSTLCLPSPRDPTHDIAVWLHTYEHVDTQTHADTLHAHSGAELPGFAWSLTRAAVKNAEISWKVSLPTLVLRSTF